MEEVSSEVSATETAPTPESSAPASEASASQEAVVSPAAPAYTPNFNYKVMDKEHQFDEWVRGAITSKEHEDKLRDLYTRAHGLDAVKEKFEGYKNETVPLLKDYNELAAIEQRIQSAFQKGDIRGIINEIGLSEEHILKYAKEILDEREMPAEQRAQLERQRKLTEENANFQSQEEYIYQQQEQLSVQNRTLEMKMELFKPEVSSFQQKFDSMMGTPGAFENAVISAGQYIWHQYQQDLPPAQVIGLVMNDYSKFVNQPQSVTAPEISQQNTVATQEKKPVLPNMGNGGTKSPAKQPITSISQLKQLRQSRGL